MIKFTFYLLMSWIALSFLVVFLLALFDGSFFKNKKNDKTESFKAGEKIDKFSLVKIIDEKIYKATSENKVSEKDHIWKSIRHVNFFGNTRYTVINKSDLVSEESFLPVHSILQKRGFPICPIDATMDMQHFHWEIHTDHNGKTHVKCTKKYPWANWPDEAV